MAYSRAFAYFLSVICFCVYSAVAAGEVRVERIGDALRQPWGMDFLDDDVLLISEKRGKLWRYDLRDGARQEITGAPQVMSRGQGGLLDVLVHDGEVYLCFSRRLELGVATAISRGSLVDNALTDNRVIFTSNLARNGAYHFGCRLEVQGEHLYATLGDRGMRHSAQDPLSHGGAIVRLNLDGSFPEGDSVEGWAEGLYSKGSRNAQGMAIHPESGAIWIGEHGPKGGDEINVLRLGANFGWPLVSHGREYSGGKVGEGLKSSPSFDDPIWVWVPSIAPSGMAFYVGASADWQPMFPEWEGSLLVTSLKYRSLYIVKLEAGLPVSEEAILSQQIGRIRDVEVASDGSILLLTDENNGGLFRLTKSE